MWGVRLCRASQLRNSTVRLCFLDDEETQVVDLKCGERLPAPHIGRPHRPSCHQSGLQRGRSSAPALVAISESVWTPRSGSVPLCSRPCWRCRCRWRGVGEVLGIERQKSSKRAATSCAIFPCPASPRKANGQRTRKPSGGTHPEKWQRFKEYCVPRRGCRAGKSGRSCAVIPFPRRNRSCTVWIRRSTTGASGSIPCW